MCIGGDVDVAVFAGEAHREPFLFLAAIFALERDPDEMRGKIVGEPPRRLADDPRLAGAGLLFQLAQRGFTGRFALVDAALRHLPGEGAAGIDLLDAVADPDKTIAIDEHDTDARPVGQTVRWNRFSVFLAMRHRFSLPLAGHFSSASAVTGTSV